MNEGSGQIEVTDIKVREAVRLTLRKSARLRHRSLVERLFADGDSFYAYPLRVTARVLSDEALQANFKDHVPDRIGPVQILLTVPKKKRKHAVDRVLMRRRMRESFRINGRDLRDAISNSGNIRTLSLAIIYIADANEDYAKVEKAMKKLLRKLNAHYLGDTSGQEE